MGSMIGHESDYDKVHVVPLPSKGHSEIAHRGETQLSSPFHGLYPIISSPMKGISGINLVREMYKNECIGVLHRFDTPENRSSWYHQLGKENVKYGVAIGINDWETEFDLATCAYEHNTTMILVDCANGYLPQLKEIGRKLYNRFSDINLVAGNVVTYDGAQYLRDCGFDTVRVGIGSGQQCSTRKMTGIGRNQLTAIEECAGVNVHVISDGGINEPHKAVKSFVAGADYVMLGSILGRSVEAENEDGVVYGMASRRNHLENGKKIKSIEGIETRFDPNEKIPLSEILNDFIWGLRSAMTYCGALYYQELKSKAKLEPIEYRE